MELLTELTNISAPSGNEVMLKEFITKQTEKFADQIYEDTLGNLIVHKKGKGNKLMLSAHMDEAGFIVTHTDDNYAYFSTIGDVQLKFLHACKVKFLNDTIGIISKKSENPLKTTDYFIETLGCKGDCLNSVSVGDIATYHHTFDQQNNIVSAKALNSRAACYILIQTIKKMVRPENDLYFVFTTQHHLGLRGAKTAASKIAPQYAITIDSSVCDSLQNEKSSIKMEEGPVIKIMDGSVITHPTVRNIILNAAKKENIDIQFQVSPKTKSDASSIQVSGVGVITGVLSFPLKNFNTACEIVSKSDIDKAIEILVRVCSEKV
ncbi:MAG: hypothetical protein GX800_01985 [Clostridiaceae bacterium]|nr:hypothetical protein [Clostridiaceae bacterium]